MLDNATAAASTTTASTSRIDRIVDGAATHVPSSAGMTLPRRAASASASAVIVSDVEQPVRIALCFYGLIRNLTRTVESLQRNLLEPLLDVRYALALHAITHADAHAHTRRLTHAARRHSHTHQTPPHTRTRATYTHAPRSQDPPGPPACGYTRPTLKRPLRGLCVAAWQASNGAVDVFAHSMDAGVAETGPRSRANDAGGAAVGFPAPAPTTEGHNHTAGVSAGEGASVAALSLVSGVGRLDASVDTARLSPCASEVSWQHDVDARHGFAARAAREVRAAGIRTHRLLHSLSSHGPTACVSPRCLSNSRLSTHAASRHTPRPQVKLSEGSYAEATLVNIYRSRYSMYRVAQLARRREADTGIRCARTQVHHTCTRAHTRALRHTTRARTPARTPATTPARTPATTHATRTCL